LKLARQYHRQSPKQEDYGRFKIIALRGSYHGCDYGATTLAGLERHATKFGPMLPGVLHIDPPYCYRCPYQKASYPECGLECAKALENTIQSEGPESVAAFIFEPIMGEMGVIIPPDEYYHQVGEICRQYGLLLIADEITTGFGRTGQLFVSQNWNPQPDILLMGKAISGGYLPMAATLTTEAIFERFYGNENYFMHGSTNSGHPVCAAASLAAINIIMREKLVENSAKVGEYLLRGLKGIMNKHPIIGELCGRGLMIGIDLTKNRLTKERFNDAEIINILISSFGHGLLHSTSEVGISLFPPLNSDEALADDIIGIMDKVLHTGRAADLNRNLLLIREFIRAKI